jgi:23S rRNA (adenine2503-C2)-methyltransferase
MPIDRAHSLDDVLDAAVEHARVTGLSPMWAMTLLAGVNDDPEDARALAARAHAFEAATGVRPRLSLIAYNAIGASDGADAADPFARTSDRAMAAFRAVLADAGLASHRRYSGGGDIGAACGQLASVTTSVAS